MEDTPTYYAGQTVAARMECEHKKGAEEVRAIFVLDNDPDVEFELSGKPYVITRRGEDNVRSEVDLTGYVDTNDAYGVYTCRVLEADYPGGRTVQFEHPVNVRFQIAEEDIKPPRGIDESWQWIDEADAG